MPFVPESESDSDVSLQPASKRRKKSVSDSAMQGKYPHQHTIFPRNVAISRTIATFEMLLHFQANCPINTTLKISPHVKGSTPIIYVCTRATFNCTYKWAAVLIVKATCFSISVDTYLELSPH